MKRKHNSLAVTNPFLRTQRNLEDYFASTITSSAIIEGIRIPNPFIKKVDLSINVPSNKPKYKSLWK